MDPVARRRFLVSAGALLTAPLVRGQVGRARAPFRIGLFPDYTGIYLQMLKDAMKGVSWREGRDYVFVASGAGYGQPTDKGARRLVDQEVDLILVNSTAHALAAHMVSKRIPIVMLSSGYPVEAGVANSLARPGKNVTGMTLYAGTGIWGKLLELLQEVKPGIQRVSVPWGYVPPAFPRTEIEPCYRELRSAAQALGLSLHIEEIASSERVQSAVASIEASTPDALLITAGPGIWKERERIVAFAADRRLPTIADFPWPQEAGRSPLLSFGGSFSEGMRQATTYTVRILGEGARPGELPIQHPSKFNLVVNLKTAKAIGITIPQSIMLRADRVIE